MNDTTIEHAPAVIEEHKAPLPDAVPERRFLSLDEVRNLGQTFFDSGLFKDVRSAAQAIVKIVAGQELGIGPMSAMTQIQIVEGKPTLTAPAIGGRVKASGRYDYRITEHSNEVCHLVFFERGEVIGESRFTLEDAKAAGLAGKDVWKKYPRNMLFARAMTNGARWYCADVFNGAVYTAEEIEGLPSPGGSAPRPVGSSSDRPAALPATGASAGKTSAQVREEKAREAYVAWLAHTKRPDSPDSEVEFRMYAKGLTPSQVHERIAVEAAASEAIDAPEGGLWGTSEAALQAPRQEAENAAESARIDADPDDVLLTPKDPLHAALMASHNRWQHTESERHSLYDARFGVTSAKKLTRAQAKAIIKELE